MAVDQDYEFEYNGLVFGANNDIGLTYVTGLDPVDIREDNVTKSAEHGSFIFANWLDERRIILEGDIAVSNPSLLEAQINLWRLAFNPRPTPIPMYFQLPSTGVRFVNCVPIRRSLPVDRLYQIGAAQWRAELAAEDPRIYGNALNNQDIDAVSTLAIGIDLPIDFPFGFGGGASGSANAINAGSFDSPPTLRIDGPCTTPMVHNITAGKFVKFNITLATGEFLIVDHLRKTVMLGGTASRYSTMDANSAWWMLLPGTNSLQFVANGAQPGVTGVTVSWRDAWV